MSIVLSKKISKKIKEVAENNDYIKDFEISKLGIFLSSEDMPSKEYTKISVIKNKNNFEFFIYLKK